MANDRKEIQALHAAISRRDWHAVEVAANVLRDQEARPAAPVEGLETVAWNCTYPTYGHLTLKEQEAKQAIEDGATVVELVTRSQSEAIIAAQVAEINQCHENINLKVDFIEKTIGQLHEAEAIIAAKDQTISDLRSEVESLSTIVKSGIADVAGASLDDLEAANAALTARVEELNDALERQSDNMAFVLNHMNTEGWFDKFTSELSEDRAVLGDKP